MSDDESTRIEDVVESILTEERPEPDLAIALEVAERINQSKEELSAHLINY